MLKAEQIPDEVVTEILIRFPLVFSGQHEARAILTAMLRAWPGMSPIRTDQPIGDWCDKLPAIILPLSENTND